jgi:hypothetical protein
VLAAIAAVSGFFLPHQLHFDPLEVLLQPTKVVNNAKVMAKEATDDRMARAPF